MQGTLFCVEGFETLISGNCVTGNVTAKGARGLQSCFFMRMSGSDRRSVVKKSGMALKLQKKTDEHLGQTVS